MLCKAWSFSSSTLFFYEQSRKLRDPNTLVLVISPVLSNRSGQSVTVTDLVFYFILSLFERDKSFFYSDYFTSFFLHKFDQNTTNIHYFILIILQVSFCTNTIKTSLIFRKSQSIMRTFKSRDRLNSNKK